MELKCNLNGFLNKSVYVFVESVRISTELLREPPGTQWNHVNRFPDGIVEESALSYMTSQSQDVLIDDIYGIRIGILSDFNAMLNESIEA